MPASMRCHSVTDETQRTKQDISPLLSNRQAWNPTRKSVLKRGKCWTCSPRSSSLSGRGVSPETTEAEVIIAIATSRQPGRSVKEIRPGFHSDERETNYVWFVLLEPTGDPLATPVTTVDTNDIRAWQQQHQNPGFSSQQVAE